MIKNVLVTGATGTVGSRVIRSLIARGIPVRAASRTPPKIIKGRDIEAVRFDYTDEHSMDQALKGVEGVFMIAIPLDAQAARKLNPFIDKAKKEGVKHIVFLSVMGADKSEDIPLRVVENHLIGSGIHYTILRPTFFMDNFSTGFLSSSIKEQGGIFLPAGDGIAGFISAWDIAEVAAEAFSRGLYEKEYNLTGPTLLDHEEATRIISEITGRKIVYHNLSEEEFMKGARDSGTPEEIVQYMASLYVNVRNGASAVLTDDVEKVTGRKPEDFKTFVKNNMKSLSGVAA